MKRSIVVLLGCIALGPLVVLAQVVPSATGRTLSIYAGGEGSIFQPDYAGGTIAQTAPNRLYGLGAFVDFDCSRWVHLEAEGRWLDWNQYKGIDEHTYMLGPRLPFQYKRFSPYGKFLFGFGNGSFLTGRSAAFAYGGGVDYRLSRKLNVRLFDMEFQSWHVAPTLHPYGGSIGISYRVF